MAGPRTVGRHVNVVDMPVTPLQDHSEEWWVYLQVTAPDLVPTITLHCGECDEQLFKIQSVKLHTERFQFGGLRAHVRDHINELHPGGRP